MRSGWRASRLFLIAVLLLLGRDGAIPSVRAHGMRTGYLEVAESQPGAVTLSFRAPQYADAVQLELDAGCRPVAAKPDEENDTPESIRLREGALSLRCRHALSSTTLRLQGLGPSLNEVVVLITLADGSVRSQLLTVAEPGVRMAGARSPRRVSAEYVALGLRHILSGADHLLFLLLLVFGIGRLRGILYAETAFTISHSLSFSATALGWVQVSAPAAEACIALSLLLLALDVNRPEAPRFSTRHATALAFVFGLVHGLGFAGGLREAGLPEQAAAWALLGFGIGVELGQVAFLLCVVVSLRLLSGSRWLRPVAMSATYAAGGLAAYWLLARLCSIATLAGPRG